MRTPNSILKQVKARLTEYKLGVIEYNEKEVRRLQRTRRAIKAQLEVEYQPNEWRTN